MKNQVAIVSCAFLLAGCSYELPLVDSGFVETHSRVLGLDRATTTELSAAQIKALSEWFARHPTGWEYKVADIAPGAFVYLKHGPKNVAGVNLRPEGVYVASYFRSLTADEHSELASIIGAQKG